MFDESVLATLQTATSDTCSLPVELGTVEQLADAMESVQAVQDRLDGLQAALLQAFTDVDGPTEQGTSSAPAWCREHLRLEPRQAKARVAAGDTLRKLPMLAEASRAGEVRSEHVRAFGYGIKKVGLETMVEAEAYLVPAAKACDPADLRTLIRKLVDVVHPEQLDQAWIDGMDKHDLKVSPVGDGYAVTGFLANPGCRNTHLELHHVIWWSHGGATDLVNLVGLCPRCHQNVHAGRLTVAADNTGGFTFATTNRRPRADHWRTHRHRIKRYLKRIRTPAPAPVPHRRQ